MFLSVPPQSLIIKVVFTLRLLKGRRHHVMNIIIRVYNTQVVSNIKSLTMSVEEIVGKSSGANVVSLDIEILTVRKR